MEITSNAVQVVTAGNNVNFTETAVPGNCSIMHREGAGQVKLRGLTSTQCRARFKVYFGANIAIPTGGTVGPISLVLTIDGDPVATTTMIVTPAAVENFFNVSAQAYIDVPCGCCSTLAVQNTSTQAIEVQNGNLIVVRTC